MASLEKVLLAVDEYQTKIRHPDLTEFRISGLYSLFPADDWTGNKWPGKYEHADDRGVYLMMPTETSVNYIGKTSMSNCFGSRFGSYFGYTTDRKGCQLNHQWVASPRFVLTIAVPVGFEFEAPALEEYLIREFHTSLENKLGV